MKIQSSLLNSSIRRRFNSDLPDATVVDETKGAGAAKPEKKAKSKKAPAKAEKKVAAKSGKKAAGKPAKKEKAAAVERKPRKEGRVDLVFRSGPERAIALALGEKHKAGEPEKVDNCTVGYTIKGAKADALREEYTNLRDEWRKAQDELTTKFLAKAAK